MMPLVTARLRLRQFVADDASFVMELLNEPGWLRFIGDRGVHDLDGARAYIEKGPRALYARHGFGLYCVELRQGGPVGMCGLLKRDTLELPDLGFALLERFQGEGYAREAVAATLAHAQRDFNLRQLAAITNPDNVPSGRLLRDLGFRFVDTRNLTAGDPVHYYVWQSAGGSSPPA